MKKLIIVFSLMCTVAAYGQTKIMHIHSDDGQLDQPRCFQNRVNDSLAKINNDPLIDQSSVKIQLFCSSAGHQYTDRQFFDCIIIYRIKQHHEQYHKHKNKIYE